MEVMRCHICVRTFLLLAVWALPVAVVAQKFQEPTKEELQMTSDPNAPGAPAVYLYLEQKADNRGHYVSEYARIKVLTEAGKRWASIEIPSEIAFRQGKPIVEGRTIHEDGQVIPWKGNASQVVQISSGSAPQTTYTFTLPDVDVGSVIEYRWTVPIISSDGSTETTGTHVAGVFGTRSISTLIVHDPVPEWQVQREIPVRRAHFYYNPLNNQDNGGFVGNGGFSRPTAFQGWLYTERLQPGDHVVKSQWGDYTLDVQDVPAFVKEPDQPPARDLEYHVAFFWAPDSTPNLFWNHQGKKWSQDLDQLVAGTSLLREASAQITAGVNTADGKARKIYDAVQAIRGANSSEFTKESPISLEKPASAWQEKKGSSNDMAVLYLALARAAGLESYGFAVASRDKRTFDPNYLSFDQFDSLLVVVRVDGKDIYLDPGQLMCPFGQLHWEHSLSGGYLENAERPSYTPSNNMKDAVTAHSADLTFDARGAVSGTMKILMSGPAALYWRQLNSTADGDRLKKEFSESLRVLLPASVSGEITGFQGLDNSAGYLSVAVKVSGQVGKFAGERLLLPGFFFSTGAHKQFVSEEMRESAVDLHYAEQVIDDVVYHLPAGFTVESAPQPAQLPWPDHAALVVKTAPGPGVIDIKHIFARAFALLDPKEYPALREYYQKIAASDQQQLVLTPSGGAPGN